MITITLSHALPAARLEEAFNRLLADPGLAEHARVVGRQYGPGTLRVRLAGDHLADGIATLTPHHLELRLELRGLARLAEGRVERELTTLLTARLSRLALELSP